MREQLNTKVDSKILERKHVLAIDYGRKYTGIATHRVNIDPIIIPFGRIKYADDEQLASSIIEVIEEEFIDLVVLGVPLFTDGKESTMTKTVLEFAKRLEKSLSIPMYLQDETLSTMEAEDRMKNSPRYNFQVDYSKIDAVAATIILEDFLNRSSDRL
ncbi:MAG: Holliday junction resolvase RuvX [Bacteriovoracaceae bacterium]|nr:Holliday junction resolvase RuvX [Bacteriovoracaceae bacterium]